MSLRWFGLIFSRALEEFFERWLAARCFVDERIKNVSWLIKVSSENFAFVGNKHSNLTTLITPRINVIQFLVSHFRLLLNC